MLPACESPEPPYALSDNRRKPLGHESPIGPCIATLEVDNRQACRFRKPWAPSHQRNGTTGRKNCFSASHVETTTLQPEEDHSSNGWAECREKNRHSAEGELFSLD